ncbi:MAG: hypothetical protein LBU32_14020 [Clostridiales bacterium]|jgi:hypothetical protein|nr:hypothetical protein [Clostridiales bacterium]
MIRNCGHADRSCGVRGDIPPYDELQDGEVITILNIGELEANASPVPYIGDSYATTITCTESEYAANTYFVE